MKTGGNVSYLANNLITPIGKAMWCKVVRPDTKFDEGGVYSTDLILEGQAAQDLVEKIDGYAAQYQKEIKKKVTALPYSEVIGEDGEPTGEVKFKFKLKATTSKGPRRPAVYDSMNRQLTAPPEVGNGSMIRVKFTVTGYKLGPGISLQLSAVQIVELVEFGGNDTGFAPIEGGFATGGQDAQQEEQEDW